MPTWPLTFRNCFYFSSMISSLSLSVCVDFHLVLDIWKRICRRKMKKNSTRIMSIWNYCWKKNSYELFIKFSIGCTTHLRHTEIVKHRGAKEREKKKTFTDFWFYAAWRHVCSHLHTKVVIKCFFMNEMYNEG